MGTVELANMALERRPDFAPIDSVPQGITGVAAAGSGASAPATTATSYLQAVTSYIPVDILTLYVAVIAALQPAVGAADASTNAARAIMTTSWAAFYFFLFASPALVWIFFATKLRQADKPLPLRPGQWPLWEMSAATLAFFAWAFALPDAPFSKESWYSPGLAAVIVLVVAGVIGALAPLMQRPLKQ